MSTKRKGDGSPDEAMKKQKEAKDTTGVPLSAIDVSKLSYLRGFGNHFESEALEGALPKDQNTPQKCAYGLYAEQLSGTSFTTPRLLNQRSWLYRAMPSARHRPLKPIFDDKETKTPAGAVASRGLTATFDVVEATQIRWKPFPMPPKDAAVDWLQGMNTVGGAGSPDIKTGFAIHVYACNKGMGDKAFCNSDGDFLIVPQEGALTIRTEFGVLHVPPRFIAVIQRGIYFQVDVSGPARGYVCEVFNGHLKLPELGPIGANGLANGRDFESPTASYEIKRGPFTVVQKFCGKLFSAEMDHSPFNVVAWHGNYVPYRYDLDKFNTINTVSYDHLDPSIFTVLTCGTNEPGVACLDFVIFPPRWLVAEKTFRPPYYHRNCMTEFMGNICGRYEAKPEGFLPGGASLHSVGVPHGPDADTYKKASTEDLTPKKLPDDSLSFMFESTYIMKLTEFGAKAPRDEEYYRCWEELPEEFDPSKAASA